MVTGVGRRGWIGSCCAIAVASAAVGAFAIQSGLSDASAPSPHLVGTTGSPPAGAVYGWMDDDTGQLGIGDVIPQYHFPTPLRTYMPSGTTSVAVAAGQSHSLALTATGSVYAFGYNGKGQLGDGNDNDSSLPVEVSLPAGVTITAIAAGWEDSLALTSTGSVYAWGDNVDGELGDGSTSDSDLPVPVDLPAGVKVAAIAAGEYHSLAVTTTGAVYAWGNNGDGQLGIGTTTNSDVPVEVDLPAGVSAAAVGAGDNHSLVTTTSGAVYAWGDNTYGELGDGTTTQSDVPVQVQMPAGTDAVSVVAGGISPTATSPEGYYSLALTSTGAVYAWGSNAVGELGTGNTTSSDVPVLTDIPSDVQVVAIGCGPGYAHALTAEGDVYQWGLAGSITPVPDPLPFGLHATAISTGPDGEQILAIMG